MIASTTLDHQGPMSSRRQLQKKTEEAGARGFFRSRSKNESARALACGRQGQAAGSGAQDSTR